MALGVNMEIDISTLVTNAPFYAGLLWFMRSFLKWLDADRKRQTEERETLYSVIKDSAELHSEAILALTSQCAKTQANIKGRRTNESTQSTG